MASRAVSSSSQRLSPSVSMSLRPLSLLPLCSSSITLSSFTSKQHHSFAACKPAAAALDCRVQQNPEPESPPHPSLLYLSCPEIKQLIKCLIKHRVAPPHCPLLYLVKQDLEPLQIPSSSSQGSSSSSCLVTVYQQRWTQSQKVVIGAEGLQCFRHDHYQNF